MRIYNYSLAPKGVISPMSLESISVMISSSVAASATWISANRAVYIAFRLYVPAVVTKIVCINGATASGNMDVGIYTIDGTRIVSKGSTAQSGTNALQTLDITDTQLFPGSYLMAMVMDNATGTVFRKGTNSILMKTMGCYQQATAFPLPATATFATLTGSFIPILGLRI